MSGSRRTRFFSARSRSTYAAPGPLFLSIGVSLLSLVNGPLCRAEARGTPADLTRLSLDELTNVTVIPVSKTLTDLEFGKLAQVKLIRPTDPTRLSLDELVNVEVRLVTGTKQRR